MLVLKKRYEADTKKLQDRITLLETDIAAMISETKKPVEENIEKQKLISMLLDQTFGKLSDVIDNQLSEKAYLMGMTVAGALAGSGSAGLAQPAHIAGVASTYVQEIMKKSGAI